MTGLVGTNLAEFHRMFINWVILKKKKNFFAHNIVLVYMNHLLDKDILTKFFEFFEF